MLRTGVKIGSAMLVLSTAFLSIGVQAATIGGVAMPTKPEFDVSSFPNCGLEYTRLSRFEAQVQSVQNCINDLEAFNSVTLPDYVQQMKHYVDTLQKISAISLKNRLNSLPVRQKIADFVRDETNNSDVNHGMYFTKYRLYVERYKSQVRTLLAVRARQQFPSN